jgi:hypothetical protein
MTTPQSICACRQDRLHKGHSICENSPAPATAALEKPRARRSSDHSRRAAGWALPSLGLVLVPKCPMCIAAWLALGGGLGVSFTTAAYLRTGFVWLCWGVLALMAVRLVVRFSAAGRSVLSGK